MERKCKKCGKSLVAIGHSRKNGKDHSDWKSRSYHKKCWKILSFSASLGVHTQTHRATVVAPSAAPQPSNRA